MNTHPLERELIYTDKEELKEFDIPEPVFDELYELFVTTKDDILDDHHTSADFFNEVFYYLTCAYANDDSAENINNYLYSESALLLAPPEIANPQTKQEIKAAREFEERTEEINGYILEFVWVILKKQKELPKHVRFFLIALEHAIKDIDDFNLFEDFVKKHPAKYTVSFEMKPQMTFNLLLHSYEDWKRATDDFDRVVVEHIVYRFSNIEDRKTIIEEMRKALSKATNDPKAHPQVSMVSHRKKTNEKHLNQLLQESDKEEVRRTEEKLAAEKSKNDRIVELEAQVKELEKKKREAIEEKKEAERERDKYRKKLDELTSRLNRKYIPAELKSEEAKLIIDELIKNDLITPLGYNSVLQFYRWEGTGALFGYFVDKMNFQLELADSGGRLNWKIFRCAFGNYEEKEKRARDTVSFYKQHPETKMPENAEKIDEAIANAEIILQGKNLPKPPKIKPG